MTVGGLARADAIHPAVAAPLAALEEAGVRWCLLRGRDELDGRSDDVDLLVHPLDLPGARRALAEVGFAASPAWGRRPHRHFVATRAATVKLDIVTELAFGPFGELPTGAARAVLAGAALHGPVRVPAPVDAFWALALHVMLDRPHIRAERGEELVALAPGARGRTSRLADVVAAACPPGYGPARVLDAVEGRRWAALEALGAELARRWPGTTASSRARTVAVRHALRRAQRAHSTASIASKRLTRSTG